MLRGRVAVVTGSTSGTGLRIACKLAAAGADLAINDSENTAEAEILRQELSRTYGVHVVLSSADISKPFGAARLISDVTRALGRVDVLVNNTGIQHDAAVQEFPVEQWHSIIANNLTAVFLTTQAVLPQMFDRNWGRVINVASVSGLIVPANAACFASTYGVVGLTKCVALETAATGITCNAICPAALLSASYLRKPVEALSAPKQLDLTEMGAIMPGEGGSPHELPGGWLGDLVKFLCSDAAAHLNGVALPVDGG